MKPAARPLLVVCAAAFIGLSADDGLADGSATSFGLNYSPIVFVPLEGGSVFHRTSIVLSASGESGTGTANTPTHASSVSASSGTPQVLGSFVMTHSAASAASTGNAAFANGFSNGWAANGTPLPDAVSAQNSTGSGSQMSLAELAGGSGTAQSTGDASATSEFADISSVNDTVTTQTEASASSVFTGLNTTTGLSEISPGSFAFNNTDDGVTYSAAGPDLPPFVLYHGDTGAIDLDLAFTGDDVRLESTFDQTPLISAITSSSSDVSLALGFGGDRLAIDTTGNDAAAINLYSNSLGATSLSFTASGDEFGIATGGSNANGVLSNIFAVEDITTTFEFAGNDATLATTGDGSAGVLSLAQSRDGAAQQSFVSTGNQLQLSTGGDDAAGLLIISKGGVGATNIVSLSGDGFEMSTTGNRSAALATIAQGNASAESRISLTASNGLIASAGNDSPAIFSAAMSVENSMSEIAITGKDTLVQTTGDNSSAVSSVVFADGDAINQLAIIGTANRVETTGSQASAVYSMTSGNRAATLLSLGGNRNVIETSTDLSVGAIAYSIGIEASQAGFSITGNGSGVRTHGDFAAGVALGAAGSPQSRAELLMDGTGAFIETRGDNASGVTMSASHALLMVGNAGGAIETHGTGAHAIFLESMLADLTLSGNAEIAARGSQSDGVFSQIDGALTKVVSSGSIFGERNGINLAGLLQLENRGRVSANAQAGIAVEGGKITNYGHIGGASAIVARQTSQSSLTIRNLGGIFANDGFGGAAIAMLGDADDILQLGPWASVSGTIDMGAGDDRLDALPGTSVDLALISPFEAITAPTGAISVLDGGSRVVIVDGGLLESELIAAELIQDVIDLSGMLAGSDQIQQEDFAAIDTIDGCSMTNGASISVSTRARSGDDSLAELDADALVALAHLASSPCDTEIGSVFVGYADGRSVVGGSEADFQSAFAGVAGKTQIDAIDISGYLAGGVTGLNASRRIINNRLDAGFEYATTDKTSAFAMGKIEIATAFDAQSVRFAPFASIEASFGNTGAYAETGAASAASVEGAQFSRARGKLGIRMEHQRLAEETALQPQGAVVRLRGEVALTYDTRSTEGTVDFTGGEIELTNTNEAAGASGNLQFEVSPVGSNVTFITGVTGHLQNDGSNAISAKAGFSLKF